jgi:hypothetical protein
MSVKARAAFGAILMAIIAEGPECNYTSFEVFLAGE